METDPFKAVEELDLIWGSPAIARVIGRKQGITAYMLQKGQIPGARKMLGQWVVARSKLRDVDFRRELTRDFRREVTRLHVWFWS